MFNISYAVIFSKFKLISKDTHELMQRTQNGKVNTELITVENNMKTETLT